MVSIWCPWIAVFEFLCYLVRLAPLQELSLCLKISISNILYLTTDLEQLCYKHVEMLHQSLEVHLQDKLIGLILTHYSGSY